MKILVLSDSHAGLIFMRYAIQAVKPDAVVHLGDYYEDASVLAEENPRLRFHQVPGNCDRNRMLRLEPEVICYNVCGVKLYMTHGHVQQIKRLGLGGLIAQAAAMGAQAALYGHTHIADCRLQDGMWILNPGACGSSSGTVGLIETEKDKIIACRILQQADLEAML